MPRLLLATAAREGKLVWVSEYGDGEGSGMTLAGVIIQDLKYLQASGWINWQAVSPGKWGMIVNDHVHEAWERGMKYFVMAHFSRFIRPGYQIIGVDDASTLAAYDRKSGTLVIVFPNFSTQPGAAAFDLSRFRTNAPTARWFQTEVLKSGGDQLAEKPALALDAAGVLNVNVSPGSLSTFVIQASIPAQASAFAGSGTWFLRHPATGRYLTGGPRLGLAARSSVSAQQFRFESVSAGYYRIVDGESGQDLNVSRASVDPGESVIQYPGVDIAMTAQNSQWAVEPAEAGAFRIKARHSGLYLTADVNGNIVQQTAHDAGRWLLERAGRSAGPSRSHR